MKQMIFLAFVAFGFSAWAQAPAKPEAMKEAPKPEAAKAEPVKEAAKPEPTKKAAAKTPRRWNEDARHCLERGSNTDVIKCAEEFL